MAVLLVTLALASVVAGARADDALQTPLRDPWVPPAVRKDYRVTPPTRGEALKAQVTAKLRSAFDAADVERRGSVTQGQAEAAGLGVIARNFGQIDRSGAGRVTFDDFVAFLHARGSSL
jgi:hypothetical protein